LKQERQMTDDLLLKEVRRLIAEGRNVTSTRFDAGMRGVSYLGGRPIAVDLQAFSRWQGGCKNLMRMLGALSAPWTDAFNGNNRASNATKMLGNLEAIEQAVTNNLLRSVEDLVRAESFDSLRDQAEFLHQQGFFLAAGVLGRAVLEEHLRNWVANSALPISKIRPTLNDFKEILYKDKRFSLSVMKHIESMAAVGNDAAHNKQQLTADEVSRLLRDVREFIGKHP
jgi:hypothetical protein